MVKYAAETHTIESSRNLIGGFTRSGGRPRTSSYGKKIPTDYRIRLDGKGPWRRVYCTCFSNIGSLWITFEGGKLFVRDWELDGESK